jgi:hypothetical protein
MRANGRPLSEPGLTFRLGLRQAGVHTSVAGLHIHVQALSPARDAFHGIA